MLKDFKTFIARGNMIDLAVGIVIGAAFGAVVNSLVKDILMPPIGAAAGGVDFSELYINLSSRQFASLKEATEAGAPTINYGLFLNAVLSFLIVAVALFLIVKLYNRLKDAPAPVAPTEKPCQYCAMPIPLSAVRCPHCTSQLLPIPEPLPATTVSR